METNTTKQTHSRAYVNSVSQNGATRNPNIQLIFSSANLSESERSELLQSLGKKRMCSQLLFKILEERISFRIQLKLIFLLHQCIYLSIDSRQICALKLEKGTLKCRGAR